jgi:hypothetical protein
VCESAVDCHGETGKKEKKEAIVDFTWKHRSYFLILEGEGEGEGSYQWTRGRVRLKAIVVTIG